MHSSHPVSPAKKSSLPFVLFLLGLVLLLVVYFQVRVYLKGQDLVAQQATMLTLERQSAELQTPALRSFQATEQQVARIQQERLKWSEVLSDLFGRLPGNVRIVSLTTDSDHKIQANLTAPQASTVSQLLSALAGSERFLDIFVPSVSTSVSPEQNQILTFPLTLRVADVTTNPAIEALILVNPNAAP